MRTEGSVAAEKSAHRAEKATDEAGYQAAHLTEHAGDGTQFGGQVEVEAEGEAAADGVEFGGVEFADGIELLCHVTSPGSGGAVVSRHAEKIRKTGFGRWLLAAEKSADEAANGTEETTDETADQTADLADHAGDGTEFARKVEIKTEGETAADRIELGCIEGADGVIRVRHCFSPK
jgi:hypothetical protein